jgi:hypothetical protein
LNFDGFGAISYPLLSYGDVPKQHLLSDRLSISTNPIKKAVQFGKNQVENLCNLMQTGLIQISGSTS